MELNCISFPTFQCYRESLVESGKGAMQGCTHSATVETAETNCGSIVHPSKEGRNSCHANGQHENTSSAENVAGLFQVIGKQLESQRISENAIATIYASCREATKRQYWTYIQRWMSFFDRFEINSFDPSINNVINFLQQLVDQGLSYSAINTARSAISSVFSLTNEDTLRIGSNPLVQRFLRGVFNKNHQNLNL